MFQLKRLTNEKLDAVSDGQAHTLLYQEAAITEQSLKTGHMFSAWHRQLQNIFKPTEMLCNTTPFAPACFLAIIYDMITSIV